MARRRVHVVVAVVLVLVSLLAACADDDEAARDPVSPTTAAPTEADLPAPLAAFLDDVAEPGTVAFTATYDVLRKLGSVESTVDVTAEPPSWRIRIGDLVVVDGPRPATCRVSARRCVGEVREHLLTDVGIFSRFFSTGPREAIAAAARREDAAAPVFSTREVAGVALDCVGIPFGAGVPTTSCLTPEGVFGFVEGPAVRVELTSYDPGPTGEEVGVPYELTLDDAFLTR